MYSYRKVYLGLEIPQIKIEKLIRIKNKGGLALPDFTLYSRAASMIRIIDWFHNVKSKQWVTLEDISTVWDKPQFWPQKKDMLPFYLVNVKNMGLDTKEKKSLHTNRAFDSLSLGGIVVKIQELIRLWWMVNFLCWLTWGLRMDLSGCNINNYRYIHILDCYHKPPQLIDP